MRVGLASCYVWFYRHNLKTLSNIRNGNSQWLKVFLQKALRGLWCCFSVELNHLSTIFNFSQFHHPELVEGPSPACLITSLYCLPPPTFFNILSEFCENCNSLKTITPEKTHTEVFFFNWNSLHARLNSHYEACSYKKRSTKKITWYRISV